MPKTRVTKVIPSGQRSPTPGAFTTWKVTSENGSPIFIPQPTTATAPPTIPPDPLRERKEGRAEVGEEEPVSLRIRIHPPGFEEAAVQWTWNPDNAVAGFLPEVREEVEEDAAVDAVSFPSCGVEVGTILNVLSESQPDTTITEILCESATWDSVLSASESSTERTPYTR